MFRSRSILLVTAVTILALASAIIGQLTAWPRLGDAAASAPRPLTYVAIGASDAVGVGADRPDVEGWVPILHGRLPPGSRLVNLGISGALARQAIEQQLPVALDSDPDIVTVWLAVNDLNARVPLDRYAEELDTIVRSLREQTHAVVAVGNIPDVASVPVYQEVDRDRLRLEVGRWNEVIAATASRHGAVLVDLHARWSELAQHPEYVGRDGFHPSTAGHRRLADLFFDAIAESAGLR